MNASVEELSEARKVDAEVAERVMGAKWYAPNLAKYPKAEVERCLIEDVAAATMIRQGLIVDAKGDEPVADYYYDGLPHYTTDATADLQVLRVVRGWSLRRRNDFYRALSLILCNRKYDRDDTMGRAVGLDVIDAYEPGDYSRAALKVD